MGIMDWLMGRDRNAGTQAEPEEIQFDKGEEQFAGLNMKEAIDAHLAWRTKLEKAVADRSAQGFEISTVATDNNCKMGKWLYNEAKNFSRLTEYEVLRKSHAEFHMLAGEILIDIRDGDFDKASQRIKTELRRSSDQVQLNLIRLCTRAQ